MKIYTTQGRLSPARQAACLVFWAGLAVACAPSVLADPMIVPAVTTAKTVQCQATFYRPDFSGKLQPKMYFTVAIAGRNNLRIDSRGVDEASSKKARAFYVTNGGKAHEYIGDDGTYRVFDASGEGSALHYMASVDLILKPDLYSKPDADVKRTITKVTVDGVPMLLRTDSRGPSKDQNGVMTTYDDCVWYDAKTLLPFRRTGCEVQGDTRKPGISVEFSHWVFDKPIPASTFVWKAPAGAKLFAMHAAPPPIAAGVTAPDFTAIGMDGKPVKLSDLKGKTVILDFWATWCHPCQQSMPHLDDVYREVKDKDVTVLAVCVWDNKANYQQWIKKSIGTKYTFPVAFDPAGETQGKSIAGKLYRVSGIPAQFVIDKDGQIANVNVGVDLTGHKLEDELAKLGVDVPTTAKAAAAASTPAPSGAAVTTEVKKAGS